MVQHNPIRVKLVDRSAKLGYSPWAVQCPNDEAKWGRCIYNADPFSHDYDWLVVKNDIPKILGAKEVLGCAKECTLLFTSEPSSVTRYGKHFAAQFGQILTSQEPWALPHPNAMRSQTGNIWHYKKSYDEIKAAQPPIKTELISTLCSSKQMPYTAHAQRYSFTQRLKREISELEVFGRGVRFIANKADAIDPYKFHLTIENHIAEHHWTEKLADAFLGYTVPIYCGCTNVYDYFPEDSLLHIDINDFDGSLRAIKTLLSTEGEYERRLDAVKEARRRVLDEYNLPAMISRIIENTELLKEKKQDGGVLYNRRRMRVRHPSEFVRFATWRISNFMQASRQTSRHIITKFITQKS